MKVIRKQEIETKEIQINGLIEKTKAIRKQEIETKEIQIGDQITIELDGFGIFTATAQEIRADGVIFMFDSCVAERYMNEGWFNDGDYRKSYLAMWMNTELYNSFPSDLKKHIRNLTIPTYGQIFGHDGIDKEYLMPDNDKQFTLMTVNENRIANYNNDWAWYWLQNAAKKQISTSSIFGAVSHDGTASYAFAPNSIGVRPVFLLKTN